MWFDLEMRPIEKDPVLYPYDYDPFLQWRGDYHKEDSKSVYSDRLYQLDAEKFNKCCDEVWGNTGQSFASRKPDEINKFLNLYFRKEVKLTAVLQCCNAGTGSPYWCFIYEED